MPSDRAVGRFDPACLGAPLSRIPVNAESDGIPTGSKTFLLTWRRDSVTTLLAVDNGLQVFCQSGQFGCGNDRPEGGRARSRGGVNRGVCAPLFNSSDLSRTAGMFSSDEAPVRLAPILSGPFGRAPRKSSSAPAPPSGGVLLFLFPLEGRAPARAGGIESPGPSARRNVAVRAGGAEIPAPSVPHTQGSGGPLEVGRRDDPQAAFGRLAWGERVANPAPLSNNQMTKEIL